MGIDPVTLTIGMTALAAGGSIAGGFADRASARAEAKQYEENAKVAKIGADQQEVARREDLVSTLSTIRAIRTSRGLDPASPTGQAINDKLTSEAERNIGTDRLNALSQISQMHGAAAVSRARGNVSLLKGFVQAGGYGVQGVAAGGKKYG